MNISFSKEYDTQKVERVSKVARINQFIDSKKIGMITKFQKMEKFKRRTETKSSDSKGTI